MEKAQIHGKGKYTVKLFFLMLHFNEVIIENCIKTYLNDHGRSKRVPEKHLFLLY